MAETNYELYAVERKKETEWIRPPASGENPVPLND
jgi:hypothetical protein